MTHSFILLLLTGLLIMLASFCFVFSFDKKRASKTRKTLLGLALILFIVSGLLTVKILAWPLL